MRARRWSVRADLFDRVWNVRSSLVQGAPVSQAASEAGLCPRHFERVFADVAGQPPAVFRRNARLELARRAILEGASVTEAQAAARYASASTFCREFRRRYGLAPSEVAARMSR
ncbi:MAG: helix-turn-helix domain-containing protein [Fimbriimonadaceae bacterium]